MVAWSFLLFQGHRIGTARLFFYICLVIQLPVDRFPSNFEQMFFITYRFVITLIPGHVSYFKVTRDRHRLCDAYECLILVILFFSIGSASCSSPCWIMSLRQTTRGFWSKRYIFRCLYHNLFSRKNLGSNGTSCLVGVGIILVIGSATYIHFKN